MAYLENGVLRSRPRPFFSQTLHRWSLILQHPTLITWREFNLLLLFLYTIYEAYFMLGSLRFLFFQSDVKRVCWSSTRAVDCLQTYVSKAAWTVMSWLGKVFTWLPIALVAIFIGEEFVFRR